MKVQADIILRTSLSLYKLIPRLYSLVVDGWLSKSHFRCFADSSSTVSVFLSMFSFRLFEVDSFDVFGTYVAVADSVFVVVGRGIVGVGTVGVGSVVSVVFVAVEMIVAVGTVGNVGSIVVGSIVLVGTMGLCVLI